MIDSTARKPVGVAGLNMVRDEVGERAALYDRMMKRTRQSFHAELQTRPGRNCIDVEGYARRVNSHSTMDT